MNQTNPFAKLGALDQMLYQEVTPTPKKDEVENPIDKQPKEKPDTTHLLANQQASKLANKQTSKSVNLQTIKPENKQTSKLANQQTNEAPVSTKEKKVWNLSTRG